MSTISTTIQLNDATTSVLQNIVNALNLTVSAFEQVQSAGDTAFDSASIEAARNSINSLDADLTQIQAGLSSDTAAQEEFNAAASQAPGIFSSLASQVKAMAVAYLGIQGIRKSIDFFKGSYEAANTQMEAETKLTTVMRQRMNATDSMVQSVKNLTAAQQKVGVVGDEVQMAGAQQLSTFLNSDKALKSLIPAMNNLAVQQNGVDATSENLVSIGNMMGKAMQGQTTTLARVGITFTDAQEQALKYGNEEQRAATLAQVITDNVGNMNQVMAQTPEGQMQQLKNTWGDIKETVGAQLYPAILQLVGVLTQQLPDASSVLDQIAGAVGNVISGFAQVLQVLGDIGGILFGNDYSWIEPTLTAIAAGAAAAAVAFGIFKVATYLLSDSFAQLTLSMLASPFTWIAIVVALVVYKLYQFVQACGGVKAAWLTAVNAVLTWADNLKIGVYQAVYSVQNWLNQMKLGVLRAWYGIEDYTDDMRVKVLNILQNLINGAISHINSFISALNNIPGVNINLIEKLDYAGTTAANIEAQKQKRTAELVAAEQNANDKAKENNDNLEIMKMNSRIATAKRKQDIDETKKEAAKAKAAKNTSWAGSQQYSPSYADYSNGAAPSYAEQTAANTGSTAANTAKAADSLEASEEDLQYITDMSAQQAINRFTTAEINFDFKNESVINSKLDIDGIVDTMTDQLREAVYATAEEVHNV